MPRKYLKNPSITACRVALCIFLIPLLGGKPKPKPVKEPFPATGPELPNDLNAASLRVHAIDTIYELDLSPEQLKMLRSNADGLQSERKRTPASADEKVTGAFADFNRALLARDDDQQIAKLRNALTELVTADDVHLDDEVEPTAGARAKAVAVCRKFSAGQIAAYLASHADQIADPAEKMVAALIELHDAATPADAATQIKDTANDIAHLVGAPDEKKQSAVIGQVTNWFKNNQELTDDQLVGRHEDLESSAKKVIGDVPPMEIINHWFENEIAELMSNPQLPQAIAAVLSVQEHEH